MNLRSFDITVCGGLLLMNRQPEFNEFFVENEEVVLYDSLLEAIEIINYLLSHEDVRKAIAQKGREKTFMQHTLNKRFAVMFSIAGID